MKRLPLTALPAFAGCISSANRARQRQRKLLLAGAYHQQANDAEAARNGAIAAATVVTVGAAVIDILGDE
jgi:hypothetical protein